MGIALGIFIGLFVGFIAGVLIGAALALASEDMFLERLSEHADSFDSLQQHWFVYPEKGDWLVTEPLLFALAKLTGHLIEDEVYLCDLKKEANNMADLIITAIAIYLVVKAFQMLKKAKK